MRYFPHIFTMWILICGLGIRDGLLAQPPAKKDAEIAPFPQVKAPPVAKFPGLGVVFVADGSGEGEDTSNSLRDIFWKLQSPFGLDVTHWSLGEGARRDHNDVERHAEAAGHLAFKVMAFRKANPHAKAILIGHSSGTHVILLAASMLPPKTVDRIILTGASVSYNFDLRPALSASKGGIDSFWSPDDGLLLWVEDEIGTADRKRKTPCAGRVGFAQIPPQVSGWNLYRNLRQYKWDPFANRFNNKCGSHFGWTQIRFLQCYVVPMLDRLEVMLPPQKVPSADK